MTAVYSVTLIPILQGWMILSPQALGNEKSVCDARMSAIHGSNSVLRIVRIRLTADYPAWCSAHNKNAGKSRVLCSCRFHDLKSQAYPTSKHQLQDHSHPRSLLPEQVTLYLLTSSYRPDGSARMDGCRRSSVGKIALPDDDVPYGYNGANRRVTAAYPNVPRNQEAKDQRMS